MQRIKDGYTLPFEFAKFGPWDPLKGEYRPALPDAVLDYQLLYKRADTGKKRRTAMVNFLLGGPPGEKRVARVVSWDMMEVDAPQGEAAAVPITEDTLATLPTYRLERLVDIVSSYGVDDQEKDLKN